MIMDEVDLTAVSKGSSRVLNVSCDWNLSEKCRQIYKKQYKIIVRDRIVNNGSDVCLFCSRKGKSSGAANGNSRYSYDRNFFANIDSEVKAYILGLIASDGHVSDGRTSIFLNANDYRLISLIADIFHSPVKKRVDMVGITISSNEMSDDICRHLQISPGKKADSVKFPRLASDELGWSFIRGYFDGDGHVSSTKSKKRHPRCDITSNSYEMLKSIKEFAGVSASLTDTRLYFSGLSALDFLGHIYDQATIYLPRKRDRYLDWCTWVPSLNGKRGRDEYFKYTMSHKDAVKPFKARVSDSGYDLTVVEKIKEVGSVEFWTTGIKIQPDEGWYFDLVPRSSMSKKGYILANMIGVIDRSYVGEIIVPMLKIDENAKDIVPGDRLVQLIPRPIVHFNLSLVDELSETVRGEGGFGSTGH